MAGHIEPLSAILRVGGAYGEPWTWAGVLRFEGPSRAVVEAVAAAPSGEEWRAAVRVMKAFGIETFRFERRRPDGTLEIHEFTT